MANVDRTGFQPVENNPSEELKFTVDASSSTAMFVGDVVDVNAAGSVRPAAGSAPTQSVGVCIALYDSNGVPVGHPNSTVSTKYLTASVAGQALVALAKPGKRFVAQSQTGKTPAAADVFATTDLTNGSGNTTTAVSGHELKYSTLNTEGQFLILGKVEEPGNSYGVNVDLYVSFNESIFGPNGKSTGV